MIDPYENLIQRKQIEPEDLEQYAIDEEIQSDVLPAESYYASLWEYIKNPISEQGATLPWSNTHSMIRFRPGETTVWAGMSGHGKSLLLGMVTLGFMSQNQKVLIASLEMKVEQTLARMLYQHAMTSRPTEKAYNEFFSLLNSQAYLFRSRGSTASEQVYRMIRFAHHKGIDHVVVDNLSKVVAGADDYNAQKDFIATVTEHAQRFNLHVHLVHHMRKSQDESSVPGKMDLKGDSSITDLADQVMIVWKNKKKAAAFDPDEQLAAQADAKVRIEKNRNGGYEGGFSLWVHHDSMQFVANPSGRPFEIANVKAY